MYLSEFLLESMVKVAYYYNNSDGTNSILKLPAINLKSLPLPLYAGALDVLLFNEKFTQAFGGPFSKNEC